MPSNVLAIGAFKIKNGKANIIINREKCYRNANSKKYEQLVYINNKKIILYIL